MYRVVICDNNRSYPKGRKDLVFILDRVRRFTEFHFQEEHSKLIKPFLYPGIMGLSKNCHIAWHLRSSQLSPDYNKNDQMHNPITTILDMYAKELGRWIL